MAGIARKIGQWLARRAERKPAQPQMPRVPVTGGHAGIAAGDLAARHQRAEQAHANQPVQPYTQEEINKWRTLPFEVVDAFVNDGQILFVHSSNVAAAQYHRAENKMMVEFLPKGNRPASAYLYSNVTPQEALEFAQAMSKGGAVWDMFRTRGSATASKKPYVKLR